MSTHPHAPHPGPTGARVLVRAVLGLALVATTFPLAEAGGYCLVSAPGSTCDDGTCLVNAGACDGGYCPVNAGECDGGSCHVNDGTCAGGACPVNAGTCYGETCLVNPAQCGTKPAEPEPKGGSKEKNGKGGRGK